MRHVGQAKEDRRNLRIDDYFQRLAAIAEAVVLRIRGIDDLHASRQEMAAVRKREGRDDAVDDVVAFEIKLVDACGDLAGIANRRKLRPLARLLRCAFVEDRDAEAWNDTHGVEDVALGSRVAAEVDRDGLIKFI